MDELIRHIEILAAALKHIPISSEVRNRVFHQEYLKSSLFSARIEGNTLTFDQIESTSVVEPPTRPQKEVQNVYRALTRLSTLTFPFSKDKLCALHQTILDGINEDAGHFRSEQSAIYDSYGNVVYLTPTVQEASEMLDVWLSQLNRVYTPQEWLLALGPIHYYLEKIHPFLDGNGRVGRIVIHCMLRETGLLDNLVLPLDEYLEQHKGEYYAFLERNSTEASEFAVFLLQAVDWAMGALLDDIKHYGESNETDSHILLPRRKEILYIIRDHPMSPLETLIRRFPTIPRRTLSYDVQWLVKHKYLRKIGSTRGVVYEAVK